MSTYISIRVSNKEQSVDGCSLPIQIRECTRYCEQADLKLGPHTNVDSPGIFCDPGVSAWKVPIFQRPGFAALWNCAKPGDRVVFLSIDRAFRSTRDFLNSYEVMKTKDVLPIFVRNDIRMDTAAGQLWARTMASFAEYQSAVTSERIREANAIRKATGTSGTRQKRVREKMDIDVHESFRNLYVSKDADVRPARTGRVFAYARVSTGGQDIQPQITKLELNIKFRVENGQERGGLFFDDGVSAFYRNFEQRAGGRQIIDRIQSGDTIICTKLDRMFRSTLDMAGFLKLLNEKGVSISTLDGSLSTDTPEGQAIAQYMCIMAEWESKSISWRTKLALDAIMKHRGPWLSRRHTPQWIRMIKTPEGGNRLEVVPEIIRDVMALKSLREEGLTLNEVSDVLQREHEIEFNFPIPVPRCGFSSSSATRLKLVRTAPHHVKAFNDYCDRFKIGRSDPIDRYYSLQHDDIRLLSRYAETDSLMDRYLEQNHADLNAILSTIT